MFVQPRGADRHERGLKDDDSSTLLGVKRWSPLLGMVLTFLLTVPLHRRIYFFKFQSMFCFPLFDDRDRSVLYPLSGPRIKMKCSLFFLTDFISVIVINQKLCYPPPKKTGRHKIYKKIQTNTFLLDEILTFLFCFVFWKRIFLLWSNFFLLCIYICLWFYMCSFTPKENERGKKEVFYVQLSSSRTYRFHVQRIKSSSRSESELGQHSSHTDREKKERTTEWR